MTGRHEKKQKMYGAVHDVLRMPAHESLWDDNPPFLTELVEDFEEQGKALGAFGNTQSQTLTGITQQQNQAETALEDAAHPLARAYRLYLRQQGNIADAAVWDLSITAWRELRENELLTKAAALREAINPLATGEAPDGARFGITPEKFALLSQRYEAYDNVIGAPRGARSTRKAQTGDLPARFRLIDGILADIDDLIIGLRGQSAAHDLFVEAYFNARRIGGQSQNSDETTTTPTNQSNP